MYLIKDELEIFFMDPCVVSNLSQLFNMWTIAVI